MSQVSTVSQFCTLQSPGHLFCTFLCQNLCHMFPVSVLPSCSVPVCWPLRSTMVTSVELKLRLWSLCGQWSTGAGGASGATIKPAMLPPTHRGSYNVQYMDRAAYKQHKLFVIINKNSFECINKLGTNLSELMIVLVRKTFP